MAQPPENFSRSGTARRWRRLGSGLGKVSSADVGVPGFSTPNVQNSTPNQSLREQELLLYLHCTFTLTVAMLLARFESGVSEIAAAFAVIVEPADAVTFTVNRTVHVVFGAMMSFS